MEEIAPNVFIETEYDGANCGLVLTEEGGVVIDTPMIPADGRAWAEKIAKYTDRVLFVFNTDYRRYNVMGNQYFDAPVLAHEEAWREMSNYKDTFIERTKSLFKKQADIQMQFNDTRIIKPELTFTGELVMMKGGRELRFVHLGGHTPATSGLYLEDCNILFTGDFLVVDEHPALGDCDSKVWLNRLKWLREQDYETIVPGHGELCDVDAVDPIIQYIRVMRVKVRDQYKQGRTKAESAVVISQMIDCFPYKTGTKSIIEKRIRAGVSRLYDEMKTIYGNKHVKNKSGKTAKQALDVKALDQVPVAEA